MNKDYKSIKEVIKNNLYPNEPWDASALFDSMGDVKKRGYLTKEEFLKIAMWKSPRPKKHYISNSEEKITEVSKRALLCSSEEEKIEILEELNGVSIAVASAFLTVIDPDNYGIIDIRVWQLLYLYGEVNDKPSGQGFNIKNWISYITILRKYAQDFNLKVRDVERTLFFYHKKIQNGLLYAGKS